MRAAGAGVRLLLPLVLVAGMLVGLVAEDAAAQRMRRSYDSGQEVVPAYEGWEQNPDGSFNLVFGTLNRNWEEELHIPIGPDNRIEPGGPDHGQPTWFLPRRNRFLFRIRVPADFGDQELVWTLTSPNGETKRAYGTLLPDYYMDNNVRMANNGAGVSGELFKNVGPTLDVHGESTRKAKVGQPINLTAVAHDPDELPPAAGDARRGPGPPHEPDPDRGHRPAALLVPLPGGRAGDVRSGADQGLGGHAGELQLALGGRLGNARAAARQPVGGAGGLQRARHLRAALHRPRRRPGDL